MKCKYCGYVGHAHRLMRITVVGECKENGDFVWRKLSGILKRDMKREVYESQETYNEELYLFCPDCKERSWTKEQQRKRKLAGGA